MIIECQNSNVQACKFYQKQGAVLSKIDMYAYYLEPEIRNEIQFIWYLDRFQDEGAIKENDAFMKKYI